MVVAVLRRLTLPLHALAPNPAAAWTIVAGTAIETALAACAKGGIFEVPGPTKLQVPLVLFLLWYAAVWALWAISRGLSRATARAPFLQRVVSAIFSAGLVVLVLLHCASWAMYFSTGQFGSIDALEFMAQNSGETWMIEYLWQSERWYVVAAAGATLVVVLGLPRLMRAVRDGSWHEPTPRSPRSIRQSRLAGCAALMTAWAVIGEVRNADSSVIRRDQWSDAVQRRLNPAVSLGLSTVRRLAAEPIDAVLDEHRLTPLDGAVGRPTPAALTATETPPSIIILAIESLRHDVVGLRHQGREVMPNLNRLAEAGVQFTRAYTQSTHSDYADVCIPSSLYPLRTPRHHYYSAYDPWPKTLVYDLLRSRGHATAIMSSQNEKWGAMDQFLATPNLDLYYDAERSGGPTRVDRRDTGFAREIAAGALRGGTLDDSYTTDKVIEWIEGQVAAGRNYCLNVNFQGSHFPYEIAPRCERPFQPCAMDFEASFSWYPPEKTPIVKNAYFNALYDCDKQLGRIVDALQRNGTLHRTVLAVLGENGEAFHENGIVSHAAEPMEPALRVAFVVHAPQYLSPRVEDYPVQLIDVVPTLFGLWGETKHPNHQGIDVLSAARPPLDQRTLFFHVENPLARCDALLYQGRWKFIRDRNRRIDGLFDVVADPGERRNLVFQEPALASRLAATLGDWRRGQLAYYHYPHYYLRYYPPPEPQVAE